MRHQYGISVAESQTFLLAKRPSAAMSEEKRLPFVETNEEMSQMNAEAVVLDNTKKAMKFV